MIVGPSTFPPPGETPRLYGRRDARRYLVRSPNRILRRALRKLALSWPTMAANVTEITKAPLDETFNLY